jgi:hypothetical protein
MKITYPHTIDNPTGEKIIFHRVQKDPDGAMHSPPTTPEFRKWLGERI